MRIIYNSIFVDDQEKALNFYTEVLGFVKKEDVAAGEFRWLTVVSPDNQEGTELVLEPNENPTAEQYQNALFEQGIPATSFGVDDVQAEYERLRDQGVQFKVEPTDYGLYSLASFEDTCGNLIQIQSH
jgi:catechol 2,3-dioxygenase-like lactoylglutathione lyase family enzyme